MKRSKIFLALTTGLLAVAGVAAAKAHWNAFTKPGYYTSSRLLCTVVASSYYTVGSKFASSATAKVGSHKLFTVRRTTAECSGAVLYTAAKD